MGSTDFNLRSQLGACCIKSTTLLTFELNVQISTDMLEVMHAPK